MNPLNPTILPQQELEREFQTPLKSVLETNLSALLPERQQTYDDILAYTLNPFHFGPIPIASQQTGSQAFTLNSAPFYWQTLLLSDQTLCSEVIVMVWQDAVYLANLNILPATIGLIAPLAPEKTMRWVSGLVQCTLQNLQGLCLQLGLRGMVSTLYNPNLAAMFKQYGFKRAKHRTEIVGLPLPALYYLDLLQSQC